MFDTMTNTSFGRLPKLILATALPLGLLALAYGNGVAETAKTQNVQLGPARHNGTAQGPGELPVFAAPGSGDGTGAVTASRCAENS